MFFLTTHQIGPHRSIIFVIFLNTLQEKFKNTCLLYADDYKINCILNKTNEALMRQKLSSEIDSLESNEAKIIQLISIRKTRFLDRKVPRLNFLYHLAIDFKSYRISKISRHYCLKRFRITPNICFNN